MKDKVRTLLESAVADARGQTKLAKEIGFTQNAVHMALKRGTCSAIMARAIDEWSNGKYSRRELCPEAFGTFQPRERSAA